MLIPVRTRGREDARPSPGGTARKVLHGPPRGPASAAGCAAARAARSAPSARAAAGVPPASRRPAAGGRGAHDARLVGSPVGFGEGELFRPRNACALNTAAAEPPWCASAAGRRGNRAPPPARARPRARPHAPAPPAHRPEWRGPCRVAALGCPWTVRARGILVLLLEPRTNQVTPGRARGRTSAASSSGRSSRQQAPAAAAAAAAAAACPAGSTTTASQRSRSQRRTTRRRSQAPPLCVPDHALEGAAGPGGEHRKRPRAQPARAPLGWDATCRRERQRPRHAPRRTSPARAAGPAPTCAAERDRHTARWRPPFGPPSKTKDPAGIMDPSRRVQQRNGRCDGAVHNSNRDAHTGDRQGPLGLPPAARPLACAEYKGLVPRVLCQTQFAVPGRRGSLGGLV